MFSAEKRRLTASKIKENLEKICWLLKKEDNENEALQVHRELALEDDVNGRTGPCMEFILVSSRLE